MIIPRPTTYLADDGAYVFGESVTIYLSFAGDPGYAHFVADDLAQRIRVATGCFITVKVGDPGDPSEAGRGAVVLTDHDVPADLGDEGYELSITPDRVTLRATAGAGLFYASRSLGQLLNQPCASAGGDADTRLRQLRCATIQDKPRFAWRGFMLDSARHFQPIDRILRLIEQIASLKLNRFHWHLTDDQGWRLEVLGYPRLTAVGAWRENGMGRYGGYYTQEQIREVIAFAKKRQITVIPEIEMPGHSLAALAAYPELGCADRAVGVSNVWGILDGVFCAGKHKTFTFLKGVLGEVADLFPGPYLHLGGDERKPGLWDRCALCRGVRDRHGLGDESALQKWFMDQIASHVHTELHRRSIAWGDNIDAGASEGQIVHGWLPEQSAKAARRGFDTINSTHEWVYLNYPETQEELAEGKPDWMRVLPLEKVYQFDPIPQDLEPELHHHVLGSEAHLWTEYVSNEAELDHQLSPRLFAFSEAVWSPPGPRDFEDFKKRLAVQRAPLFPG